MTAKEKAQQLGIDGSQVRRHCISGRFDPPAEKRGGIWFIPQDAVITEPVKEYKWDEATRKKYRVWQQEYRKKKHREQVGLS